MLFDRASNAAVRHVAVATLTGAAMAAVSVITPAMAQTGGDDLAKKLSNPVASLISVPFQSNFDAGIGPGGKGTRFTLNVQPVIPFELGPDWNLISRTVVPIISQRNILRNSGTQTGVGDVAQSFFFAPSRPGPGGILWGVGSILLFPTGSNDLLSARQFGAGPTAVALTQQGAWTIGGLGNHIWSFAETRRGARDISVTFLNPFVSYAAGGGWTFGLAAEATYDWTTRKWAAPVLATASKLMTVGQQPMSFTVGVKYNALTTPGSAKGWGVRASVVFLFPT
jgi:hypothetical protein